MLEPDEPGPHAVLMAGFVAAEVACHGAIGRLCEGVLAETWSWFESGHNPCGFATDDDLTKLMVY